MKISQLHVYPIKSLRGISVTSVLVTETGFAHDRSFMLLKVKNDDAGKQSLENMHVPTYPEMSLFTTEFRYIESRPYQVVVTYTPSIEPTSSRPSDLKTLEVPLSPDVSDLRQFEVSMHSSRTSAYCMPPEYSTWFSACFGYDVVLAYIGFNTRPILGSLSPNFHKTTTNSNGTGFFGALKNYVSYSKETTHESTGISFADCANFLVVTEESLANASHRLPEGEEMDVTKFRPNIVVTGAEKAWDEDYWGSVRISSPQEPKHKQADVVDIIFTANCVRCKSINVDYATGKMGAGPSGQMLKKLQSDRRIDSGAKYSPVFGRYGYVSSGVGDMVTVGAQVKIKSRNEHLTKLDWPGIGNTPALPISS